MTAVSLQPRQLVVETGCDTSWIRLHSYQLVTVYQFFCLGSDYLPLIAGLVYILPANFSTKTSCFTTTSSKRCRTWCLVFRNDTFWKRLDRVMWMTASKTTKCRISATHAQQPAIRLLRSLARILAPHQPIVLMTEIALCAVFCISSRRVVSIRQQILTNNTDPTQLTTTKIKGYFISRL